MTVYAGYRNLPSELRGLSIALGNFDGLHAGHLAVLNAARAAGSNIAVATFEPPPRSFFRPKDPPFRIMRPARRNEKILSQNVSAVFELPFNADIASMSDETFARDVLAEGLHASHVSIGADFRFGQGRMGDANRLAALGKDLGFGVSIVEEVPGDRTGKASSTSIRNALKAGEPERAARLLGHDWVVDGVVEHGEKRGRTIGFPTANMTLGDLVHPRHGIYAVKARIDGEDVWRDGVANFGRTPTTGLRDPLLETFIFDWTGDIYGQTLDVALVAFLRPEEKFDSMDALIDQMRLDEAKARKLLNAS